MRPAGEWRTGGFLALRDELALLADLLRGDRIAAAERLRRGHPTAAEAIAFARLHQTRPFLGLRLEDETIRESFDPEIVEQLRLQHQRDCARRDLVIKELFRVTGVIQSARVDVLLLKGPHTAQRFHGDIHRRQYGDIDLLVRRSQLPAAMQALEDDGYRRRSKVLGSVRASTYFTHGFDYRNDEFPLDLHWSLGSHISYGIDEASLWSHSEIQPIADGACRVLCNEHALTFHLLSMFEDLDRGALRLKGFVDLDAMLCALDPELDWHAFLASRDHEGLGRICRAVLRLFCDALECSDRFPRLSQARSQDPRFAQPDTETDDLALLSRARGAPANRRWAARHYDCSRAAAYLWWATSLPFRLAVYKPGRVARTRERIRHLLTGTPPTDD